MSLLPLFFLLCVSAISLSIAYEDHKTTYISVWKLAVLTLIAAAFVAINPLIDTSRSSLLIGALAGLSLGLIMRLYALWRFRYAGFGGGDIWLLGIGGAFLGVTWLPVWVLAATITAIIAGLTLSLARADPAGETDKPIAPLGGILCATMTLFLALRLLGVLPSSYV